MNRTDIKKFIDVWTVVDSSGTAGAKRDASDDPEQTDECQVIATLSAHQGYMWQGDLASSLEWSEGKTSRILSTMETEGRVTRHRVGRRKAVCLPHREPAVLKQRAEYA